MKRVTTIAAAALALAAGYVFGDWVYEGQWGTKGSGEGQFYFPYGIAVPHEEHIYVADGANHRIQYFTPSQICIWGTKGSGNGQFLYPPRVAVSNDDIIYVADRGNNRVQYFTRTGIFLGKWGSQGSGNGQFEGLTGLAVARNGNVYTAE